MDDLNGAINGKYKIENENLNYLEHHMEKLGKFKACYLDI